MFSTFELAWMRNSAIAAAVAALSIQQADGWAWQQFDLTGDIISPRAGLAVAQWPQADGPDRLLLCGGAAILDGFSLQGDCYSLVPPPDGSSPWTVKQVLSGSSGSLPARRDATAVIAYESWAIVFGGNSSTDLSLATPKVFTIGPWTIANNAIINGALPTARFGHSAVLSPADGRSWVIFGGAAAADGSLLDDVSVMDLGDGSSPTFTFSTPTVTGQRPPARKLHAAAAYLPSGSPASATVMYISGGLIDSGDALSDVWVLSLGGASAWTWRAQSTVFAVPIYGHSMAVSSGLLLLYGALTPPSSGAGGNSGGGSGDTNSTDGVPPAATSSNGGVFTVSLTDWNWRVPDAPALGFPTEAGRPAAALLTDLADGLGDRLVAFGGTVASDGSGVPAGVTGLIGLSGIGAAPSPGPKGSNVPAIIGGTAVAIFAVLIGGGVAWWLRRRSAAAAAGETAPGYVRRSHGGLSALSGLRIGFSSAFSGGGGGKGGGGKGGEGAGAYLLGGPAGTVAAGPYGVGAAGAAGGSPGVLLRGGSLAGGSARGGALSPVGGGGSRGASFSAAAAVDGGLGDGRDRAASRRKSYVAFSRLRELAAAPGGVPSSLPDHAEDEFDRAIAAAGFTGPAGAGAIAIGMGMGGSSGSTGVGGGLIGRGGRAASGSGSLPSMSPALYPPPPISEGVDVDDDAALGDAAAGYHYHDHDAGHDGDGDGDDAQLRFH